MTVSALPAQPPAEPGFVVVLEDTSELLRAQKAAAWHEVARRIAHELKNPLTPIALSRRAHRAPVGSRRRCRPPDSQRILRECAATISREVESVKTLVDEFSQFSRFPAAQPVPCDLNADRPQCAGRVRRPAGWNRPARRIWRPACRRVHVDPEQFKRVVVNLVDNAAEAMRDSLVKQLLVSHAPPRRPIRWSCWSPTPAAASRAEDKEKLFLPYFSTKGRGTGLGLAIVSHILSRAWRRAFASKTIGPRARASIVEVPVADRVAAGGGGPRVKNTRVLIVDDEPGIRESLRGVLEDEGCIVRRRRKRRGVSARNWRGTSYEVVLLDVWLARHGRPGDAGAHSGNSLRGSSRSGHDLRPRHHRNRREGHQARRVRFSRKAADHREGDGGAPQRRAAAPAGAGTQPAEGDRATPSCASSARACR